MSEEIDPLWKLSPYLSLREAASLVAGYCPNTIARLENDTGFAEEYPRYLTALAVLKAAIQCGELIAEVARDGHFRHVRYNGGESEGYWEPVNDDISTTGTRIWTFNIKGWLQSKGMTGGFFAVEEKDNTPHYLDPKHPRYAPKLAAAVKAWMAVEDTKGKTPKQALEKWLREFGAVFGLTDDEGKPNETGITECSKVANWSMGGPPKTPGNNPPTP